MPRRSTGSSVRTYAFTNCFALASCGKTLVVLPTTLVVLLELPGSDVLLGVGTETSVGFCFEPEQPILRARPRVRLM